LALARRFGGGSNDTHLGERHDRVFRLPAGAASPAETAPTPRAGRSLGAAAMRRCRAPDAGLANDRVAGVAARRSIAIGCIDRVRLSLVAPWLQGPLRARPPRGLHELAAWLVGPPAIAGALGGATG